MAASESKLWYLEQINIFRDLTAEDLLRIDTMTSLRNIGKGKYIYFPDDPSKVVFLLKQGKVKIGSYSNDGKEIIKAILEPGEIFGELAIMGEQKRKDFAQALTSDVRFCAIGVEEMKEILMSNPKLNFEVTRTIGDRLMKVERRLESLVFKDARQRILDFIYNNAIEKGMKVGFGMKLKHDLTHQDIANLTATSRQTVTIVLNELREAELINFDRKSILIHSMDDFEVELAKGN
ncbi:MAG: Crp/Fnr family transcriptional regulator [Flavobacteriales bacterium]|nr:Crp/Fnr family transcriptional regulator [Flavobacteriales bacterium]